MKSNLKIVAQGLCQLIEGQKRFADEFGLNLGRVFPHIDGNLQGEALADLIEGWLQTDAAEIGIILQHLFNAVATHQLALMGALDGIAIQTLATLAAQEPANKLRRFVYPIKNTAQELKKNQQLRYQKLVIPGFVDTYIKMREVLNCRGER